MNDNRLTDGGVVWGFQCWWGPEEQVKKRLEGWTFVQVPLPEAEEGPGDDPTDA